MMLTMLLNNLIKDKLFYLAVITAAVFWVFLGLLTQPVFDLSWPVELPGKFLLLVLLYPLVEELVFRGVIQGWLLTRINRSWRGVSLANLLTSVLFVALHLWQHPPLWAFAVFVPSLIFGFFRDRYQSVIPAIILHSFYNLGYFWMFYQP